MAGRHRAPAEVVNGYELEQLARSLFDARSMRGQPCTDEQWNERLNDRRFVTTNRLLFTAARREAEKD